MMNFEDLVMDTFPVYVVFSTCDYYYYYCCFTFISCVMLQAWGKMSGRGKAGAQGPVISLLLFLSLIFFFFLTVNYSRTSL